MNKATRAAGILIAMVFIAALTQLNYLRYFHMAGDSAGYVDLLRRAAAHADLRSKVFAAAYPLFDMAQTVSAYCSSALVSKYENNSFFQWHSYAIVFPIAWIGGIFTKNFAYVAAFVNALSVFFSFWGLLLIARKSRLNRVECALFLGLLLTFTPLMGSLSGQYYFDRLFIPTAIFYVYFHLCVDRRATWLPSVALIVLGALISERSALMTGALAVYLAVFDTRGHSRYRYATLIAGLGAMAYYVVWAKFLQDSIYAGTTSIGVIKQNIINILDFNSSISKLTWSLLTVLAPMMVLATGKKRYLLLFLAFLAPNLLLSVGGAEKTAYATHYHSYYLPIIMVASILGFARYKQYLPSARPGYALLLVILALNYLNTRNNLIVVSPTLTHNLWRDARLLDPGSELRGMSAARRAALQALIAGIPDRSAIVSSNEFVMPFLVASGFANVRMFPIGLYDSDYVILETGVSDPPDAIILPIYGDPVVLKQIAECLYARVQSGYAEAASANIGAIKYRLMKRIK